MPGRFTMDSTYSVTHAQTNLPRLIREAAAEGSIAITRHEETVAYLISRGRMDRLWKHSSCSAVPPRWRRCAITRRGKTRFLPLATLNGDKG